MMRLAVEGVSFHYRDTVIVRDVSFAVSQGETVALIGPNGAGKTTLLRIASGLLAPGTGRVMIGGDDVRTLSRKHVACRIAVVDQMPTASPDFTVLEIVSLGRYPHRRWFGALTTEDKEAIRSALERSQVESLASRRMNALSAGETRRAFLAMALAQTAPLLVLDEPFAHLDLAHQGGLLDILAQLCAADNAVLMTAHDVHIASRLATHVGLLFDHELRFYGAPAHVLTRENLERTFGVPLDVVEGPRGVAAFPS